MPRVDTLHTTDTTHQDDEALRSKIKYSARDSVRADLLEKNVYLFGAATVDYEDLHLDAERILIDMDKKELTAEGVADSLGNVTGSPHFSQGNQKFRSSTIRYNFDTKKGKIGYVITQEGDGFIHGEVVKKDPENNFFIRRGMYTTCDLDTPHFAITSNKLKVISNNKIVTGPAYLTIESVPTPIAIPFGFFPNKKGRSSGVIFPVFGESAQRGFYFQHLGYYFGFNDFFNLALTSDLYTLGSFTLDASSLYKNRYRYSGSFQLSYAYTVTSEPELPDYNSRKDFHINWSHNQDPKANPNRSFSASVNAGSSSYYQNTISSTNNFLSNTFQSSISYSRTFPGKPYNLGVQLTHSQNTITHDIRITSPDLSFNVARIYPFRRKHTAGAQKWFEKIGASYSVRATNYIQTKDSMLFRRESLDQFQNGIQHNIPISTSFNILKYFTVTPSANYTERWYFKTTQYDWDPERLQTDTMQVHGFQTNRDYQFSVGTSTRIYGMFQMPRGPIAAIRHVLTPSVSLSYRPDFSAQSFGYYKSVQTDSTGTERNYSIFQSNVYGGPPAGKYGTLSFSLNNNLEMKVRTRSDTGEVLKKIKLLESLNFGAGYNLMADSMKWSVLSVNGRTTILDKIGINFGAILDPYAFDENNRDYNRFQYDMNRQVFRLTSASLSFNYTLNKQAPKQGNKYSKQELDYINSHPEEYVDFTIPFNLSMSYTMSYSKTGALPSTTRQSASVNGDFSLTSRWKIGFNSWYDFDNGRFTNFGVNFYRDLHCWEMRLGWIPFGFQQSYNFQINVKASILQDLKLIKKRDFYDR